MNFGQLGASKAHASIDKYILKEIEIESPERILWI